MVSPKADNRLLGRRTAMNTLQMLLCRVGAGLVLGASSVVSVPAEAEAQAFPSNPIRIVVPTAPSTPPDIISRVIATELSNSEGWKVIVENRPGAVMTIAGTDVLKQPADGTSIYAMSVPVTAASAFLQNMPFQLDQDFAPVIKIATSYNVLVVTPSLAAKSVSELVNTPPITMRYGLTFPSGRMHPAHARSSGSETLSPIRSSVGYTIDMHESEFSEATGDPAPFLVFGLRTSQVGAPCYGSVAAKRLSYLCPRIIRVSLHIGREMATRHASHGAAS
jgi:hypothetical protein